MKAVHVFFVALFVCIVWSEVNSVSAADVPQKCAFCSCDCQCHCEEQAANEPGCWCPRCLFVCPDLQCNCPETSK